MFENVICEMLSISSRPQRVKQRPMQYPLLWDASAISYQTFDWTAMLTGGCLNKKDGLTRYGDSHVKDKTS